MTYVRWIEDEKGDAIDVETYCEMHAPTDAAAWPVWDAEAYCHVCAVQLRDDPLNPLGYLVRMKQV